MREPVSAPSAAPRIIEILFEDEIKSELLFFKKR